MDTSRPAAAVPPVSGATARGITLRGLKKLLGKVEELLSAGHFKRPDGSALTDLRDLTTGDVVHQWVKDVAVTGTDRLADCRDWVAEEDVRVPAYFVSHAWKGSFVLLVNTVTTFLRNASYDTAVWIDCCAVNQHRDTCPDQNKADVDSFEATIQVCHHLKYLRESAPRHPPPTAAHHCDLHFP